MKKKQECEVEKEYSSSRTISKLRRLLECLEKGKAFEIQVDGNKINMPACVEVNIEYEKEGSEHELEFKFKWER